MAWVRLDDAMPRHPKFVEAGPLAGWLFVCSLCYSNQYTTDGFIPEAVVRILTSIDDVEEQIERLVRANLLERVDGGFLIHDYLEYQPSSDKIRSGREQAKQRMSANRSQEVLKKFRRSSEEVHENMSRSSEEVQPPQPNPTQPNPTQPRRSKTAVLDDSLSGFDEFWDTYPLKKAKATARTAWNRRRFTEDERRMVIAAVKRQAGGWSDPRYIPHPATWLNQERWGDEVVVGGLTGGRKANPFLAMIQEEAEDEPFGDHETSGSDPRSISPDGDW